MLQNIRHKLILGFSLGLMLSTIPVTASMQNEGIDWVSGYYYASGEAVVPSPEEEPNRSRAILKAKGYAKMRAIADLRVSVENTVVSYRAAGRDLLSKDNDLRQVVESYMANANVVNERQQNEGNDTVIAIGIQAPMFGHQGICSAMLRSRAIHDMITGRASDVSIDRRSDLKTSSILTGIKGPFSSVIVDCIGIGIERAIFPILRRSDGGEINAVMSIDNGVCDRGAVAYSRNLDDAKRNPRAGANPLIVRAIGRAGDKYMCDAVISDPDADRVAQENETSHFLDKCNMIFVLEN